MARGKDTRNHPNRKVDRASAIIADLQKMLEGEIPPTNKLYELGKDNTDSK